MLVLKHWMDPNTEPGGQKADGILQTFWGLSSLEEDERLQSAKQLITALQQSQVATTVVSRDGNMQIHFLACYPSPSFNFAG